MSAITHHLPWQPPTVVPDDRERMDTAIRLAETYVEQGHLDDPDWYRLFAAGEPRASAEQLRLRFLDLIEAVTELRHFEADRAGWANSNDLPTGDDSLDRILDELCTARHDAARILVVGGCLHSSAVACGRCAA